MLIRPLVSIDQVLVFKGESFPAEPLTLCFEMCNLPATGGRPASVSCRLASPGFDCRILAITSSCVNETAHQVRKIVAADIRATKIITTISMREFGSAIASIVRLSPSQHAADELKVR